ncbi:hypothetical protein BJV82DRAFT_712590 [Fennellomyces sp. T-0311]|nr:hypothetical protein BJV82DRAFT_712590 [Fennellomyces sp. T-0311]
MCLNPVLREVISFLYFLTPKIAIVKVMLPERSSNLLQDTELKMQFARAIQMVELDNKDEALVSLDIALQEAQSNLLAPVLLERATVSMRNGNFKLAHKDVSIAIENAPKSPDGYIQACNFYLMQGNYRDAWLTAEKGAVAVPQVDPKWRALECLKKTALNEINKTNIWQLPYDLLSKIAEKLDFIDRVRLAASCKYWRSLLYGSPAIMWGTIDFKPCWSQDQPFKHAFTGASSQHVRTLKSCTGDVIDWINELKWKHIECLETSAVHVAHPALRNLIIRNSETLVALQLSYYGKNYKREGNSIHFIFSSCPKITSLTLYTISIGFLIDDDEDIHPSFTPFKFTATATFLTHLTLMGTHYLVTVLPNCPNLLHFRLLDDPYDTVTEPHMFALVEKYCPKLITLLDIQSYHRDIRFPEKLTDTHPTTTAPAEKGIRHLAYLYHDVVDNDAITTVTKNRNTLEHLQFGLGGFAAILAVVRTLSASPFPHLTQLELHGVKHSGLGENPSNLSSDKLYDLISACPLLESLSLMHIDILDERIFSILGDIPTLRALHIIGYITNMCEHGKAITHCGIRTLFERTKSLKDVSFGTIGNAMPLVDFIYALSARPKLEKIHLQGEGEMVIDASRLQLAKSFINVYSLTLCCNSTLTIKSGGLRLLEWLPSLSTAKFEGTSVVGITGKGLDDVFRNRRNTRLDITVDGTRSRYTKYSSKTWNYTKDVAVIHT